MVNRMITNIDSYTKLYAVLGYPVRHSRSPLIQNALFSAYNYNGIYMALELAPEALGRDIEFLKRHYAGFNATIPHKEIIMPMLDFIDTKAQWYGAVNTVKCDDGRLLGYNTDGDGFLNALNAEGVSLNGKRVLLTGAGGVARTLAHETVNSGGELTIAARSLDKAKQLADMVEKNIPGAAVKVCRLDNIVGSYDVLLQGTPVGMHPNTEDMPVSAQISRSIPIIYDTIYNPTETLLMKTAKDAGAKTINGFSMLFYQAAKAHEYWTGHIFDSELLKRVYSEILNRV